MNHIKITSAPNGLVRSVCVRDAVTDQVLAGVTRVEILPISVGSDFVTAVVTFEGVELDLAAEVAAEPDPQ